MHAGIGWAHHVASPLGAWLLLALASPAVDDAALRAEITEALGLSPDEAVAAARRLLGQPHPAVRLAAAAWHRARSDAQLDQVTAWLGTLGDAVESGPVPTKLEADQWTDEHTSGLMKRFPLEIDPEIALLLATAVATVIDWQTEFTICRADELSLPTTPGLAAVTHWLHSPHNAAYERIIDTSAGPVAVHAMASSHSDMLVVSVIGDLDLPPDTVMDHAHRVAVSLAREEPVAGERSLFDLPLGAGHSWVLAERTAAASQATEQFDTVLPAWSAESTHPLLRLGTPGFRAATETLQAMVDGDGMDAVQAALARYTRTGFEAAAVTAMGVRATALIRPSLRTIRTARVEFGHPYAVVAVATRGPGPWTGVPLFSAWIAAADEP